MPVAPTPTAGFLAIVEMVDMGEWGRRGALFAHVARCSIDDPAAGVKISYSRAAEAIATDRRYVHRLFRELRAECVLVLVDRGRGRRPSRWRVNPDLRGWRRVPWRVGVELACWRVLGIAAVPDEPVPSRSKSATPDAVVSRSKSATLREDVSRSYGATLRNPSVATYGRDTTSAPLSLGGSEHSDGRANHLSLERETELGVVVAAISEATGCDVWGRLEQQVGALVVRRGAQAVLDAAASIDPTGLQAPAFVRAVERVLAGEQQPDHAAAGAAAERRRLASERSYLVRMVEQLEYDAAEREASGAPVGDGHDLETFRERLAACEHELARIAPQGVAVG